MVLVYNLTNIYTMYVYTIFPIVQQLYRSDILFIKMLIRVGSTRSDRHHQLKRQGQQHVSNEM